MDLKIYIGNGVIQNGEQLLEVENLRVVNDRAVDFLYESNFDCKPTCNVTAQKIEICLEGNGLYAISEVDESDRGIKKLDLINFYYR